MLEQLRIRNFQAYSKLILDLSPGVTTLIGRSDIGKSSVLRALRWLLANKPQGEAFMREGQEHVSVRLKVDGHDVLRERGPGLNAYALDGWRFQAFGHDVPPEIASLLNVSELSYQSQHSAPFWLSLSPGQVSRELNAVVDLDIIDSSLAFVASEVRSARSEVEVSEKRLTQVKEERDGLAWVEEAGTYLNKIIGIQDSLDENRLKRSRIEEHIRIGEESIREGERLSESIFRGLLGLEKGEEALQKMEEAENLRILVNECSSREEESCRLEESLGAVRQESNGLMKEGICPLCGGEIPESSPSAQAIGT